MTDPQTTGLREEIAALVKARADVWATQGRDEEKQWAVRNFVTGQGGQPLQDDLLKLIDRERRKAVEDMSRNCTFLVEGQMFRVRVQGNQTILERISTSPL